MAVKYPAGTAVKQVLPAAVEGTVTRFVFDETSGDISYVITDATGQEWAFREENIEGA
jgi:hypothetical protein